MNANKLTIMLLASVGALCSCSDTWNEHYTDKTETAGTTNIMAQIGSDPELSTFAAMLELTGYDKILAASQTYTVWAPVNDALRDINLADTATVRRTVLNHISRFNISSATAEDEGVKMLNGKVLYFSDQCTIFGGARIITPDQRATNGLLHKLAAEIPYSYNFREYIDTHDDTSELSAFIAQFDESLLPADVPGAKDVSSTDTARVSYNRLLQYPDYGLGNIASEDSVFTMVVPNNAAWNKAYEEIKPYFVTYNADAAVADSIQRQQTSLAIVSDLIFRSKLADPTVADSLVTTTGSVISCPAAYFRGMQHEAASNGQMFLASALNYDMTETFNKPIEIEAEDQDGRTPAAGTTVYTRNVSTDNEFYNEVSGQRYIEVFPVSSSRQPGVTFSVPNILAGAYDVYATFVPANVTDATNISDSTRVQFAISYQGTNGRTLSKAFSDKAFVTSGTRMTTIKVTSGFKFPVANYYDRVWLMDPKNDLKSRTVTTSIYVSTNVTNSEFNANVFSRRFRIDRLVFVPVQPE